MGGVCSSQNSKKRKKIEKKKKKDNLMIQILAEHERGINCMCLNEDSSILASGSDDKTIRMWSAKTTPIECIGILKGHEDYITSLAMDSGFLVSGSADRTVRKWDTSTCECLAVMEGHSGTVNKVIITTEFIFSSSYDRTARCWDLDTGKCLRTFAGHSKSILPMVFLPGFLPTADDMQMFPSDASQFVQDENRDLLFTGSADCTIKAFNAYNGDLVKTYYGHTGAITCMTVDIETKILITGSTDRTIRSWSVVHSSPIRLFEGHIGSIISLSVATKVIYSASSDGTGRSWALDAGECTRIMTGHKSGVTCMKYRDGLVFTGSGDGFARCFSAKSGFILVKFKDKWVHEKRKRPDVPVKGKPDALACMQVKIYWGTPENFLFVLFALFVATGAGDKTARVFGAFSGILLATLTNHTGTILDIQISGGRLFTGSFDGLICVWDIEDIKDESEFVYGEEEEKKKGEGEESDSDSDSDEDEEDDENVENTRPQPVQQNGAAIPNQYNNPNKPPHQGGNLPPVRGPAPLQQQQQQQFSTVNEVTGGAPQLDREFGDDDMDASDLVGGQQQQQMRVNAGGNFMVPQNQAAAAAAFYQQQMYQQQMAAAAAQQRGAMPYNVGVRR